ncbi:MAG: CoA transferase [Nevskia sp.]|nr:CoA transferase [Nevskia sp.]
MTAAGPLAGVRVVDMTAVLLGPVASQVFGDLGADVVKVESPGGDSTRGVGAARNPGMGATFLHVNRNKRSLVLDLKQPAARAALMRVVATADVLLHNMRPQALARLGFDYASVAAVNPRIVHCGAFGYGSGGRHADRPAYDDLIQGAVAMPSLFERAVGQSCYIPAALIDRMVALSAAYSVIAALFHRERSGEGQCIEVPMFETMVPMVLGEHMAGASFDPPLGPMGYSRLLSPYRRPYRTADGYVAALAYTDRHWFRFFEFVGRPELVTDARFSTIAARTEHIDALYALAQDEYARRSTVEWVEALKRLDIPYTEVHTLESLLDDPHLGDTGYFQWTQHPSEGRVRAMPLGSQWSRTPPTIRRPAPRLGEHSRELLTEAGLSESEIEALVSSGACVQAASS